MRLLVSLDTLDDQVCAHACAGSLLEVGSRPDHLVLEAETGTPLRLALPALARLLLTTEREAGEWTLAGLPLTSDAPLGTPPLVHGARLSRVGSDGPGHEVAGVVDLHVIAGPDAGTMLSLGLGRFAVGRSSEAAISLVDPSVSRRHCLLDVTPDRLLVTDLGSTNGTGLGELTLHARTLPWNLGDTLSIGGTQIVARLGSPAQVARRPTGDGTYAVNRRPAPHHSPERPVFQEPTAPPSPTTPRLHLAALALPAVFAVGLSVALGNLLYLAMGLLSPLMAAGQFASDRRVGRVTARAAAASYDTALAQHDEEVADALREEIRRRHARAPDTADTVAVALRAGDRLWERPLAPDRPLEVRLGSGQSQARVLIRSSAGDERSPLIEGVPISHDLADGPLGIAGPRRELLGVGRALVVQLATWHSPAELHLWAIGGDAATQACWAWMSILPHGPEAGGTTGAPGAPAPSPADSTGSAAAAVTELISLLDSRTDSRATFGHRGPHHVVVLDGDAASTSLPGVARLLREGSAVGIHVIALGATTTQLPLECTATVTLTDETDSSEHQEWGRAVLSSACHPPRSLHVDTLSATLARRVAVALAPNIDGAQKAHAMPDDVRLRPLMKLDAEAHHLRDRLAAAWQTLPASSRALLGATADRELVLDLATDGPHVLIGGTTGSGKSELLRTMITSLALANRPDRLTFVLIDYKGGSAFDRCAELPHVAGLVTDLDGTATARALRALEREIQRREHVLRAAGSTDIDAHNRCASSPLARLVLVIDEYRALADELPEFLDGLLRIASLGRSLGVHLVLATQRPNGIVSADIRANVNARIALRLRDVSDAYDVVDCPDPGSFSARTPGRAVMRVGGDPPVTFQTAHVSTASRRPGERPTVTAYAVTPLGRKTSTLRPAMRVTPPETRPVELPVTPSEARDVDAASDLEILVAACTEAAAHLGIPSATPPWQPPLPTRLAVERLAPPTVRRARGCTDAPSPIPFALVDDPDQLAQWPLTWDPRAPENLAVIGGARSGRTTTLTTLVAGLATTTCPSRVAVCVVDGGGGLGWVGDLPHACALVGPQEPARLRRVVARVAAEVRHRRAVGASSSDDGAATQVLLVVIDDVDAVLRCLEPLDQGRGIEDLLEVLRSGPALGVRAVLAGGRSLLAGPLAGSVSRRVVLPLTDPHEAMLAGLTPDLELPPGRARLLPGGLTAQVAVSFVGDGDSDGDGIRERVALDGSRMRHASCRRPEPMAPALPTRITLAQLRALAADPGGAPIGAPLLGLDEDGHARRVELAGRSLAVIGPRGSGRTTALACLRQELDRVDRPVVVIRARPGRSDQAGAAADDLLARLGDTVDRAATDELARRLALRPDTTVLIDDVEGIEGLGVEDVLLSHLHRCPDSGGAVVLTAESRAFAGAFRGLVGTVRRGGDAIALMAGRTEEEALGRRLPGGEPALPGRGILVDFARNFAIQLPVPAAADAPAARSVSTGTRLATARSAAPERRTVTAPSCENSTNRADRGHHDDDPHPHLRGLDQRDPHRDEECVPQHRGGPRPA